MKNAIKRLLGMALSLCVMASAFAIPTAYAQENQQGEGQGTPQNDQVQTISEVSINGIVTPVIDSNTNDFVTSVGVSEEASYQIDSKNLYKADTTDAADTTFVKDQKYDLVIVLSAKDANTAKFSDNADDVTVNVGNKSIADGKLTVTVEDIQAVYSVKLNHNYGDPATVESKLTDASYKLSEADLTVSRDGWELKGWNTK
ncbi:MAG: hypothetical protein IJB92_07460, partial [Clostridia bacterium]|nr:hypothetical protein [Clostridia bacterium]